MAMEIEDECWPAGGSGMAILCEQLLERGLAAIGRLGARPPKGRRAGGGSLVTPPGAACLFCRRNAEREVHLLSVLEDVETDEALAAMLQAAPLCVRHALAGLETWRSGESRRWLGTRVRSRIEALAADLREFRRAQDWQSRTKEAGQGRDAASVRRAVEALTGPDPRAR